VPAPVTVLLNLNNGLHGASSVDVTAVEVMNSTGTFQSDAFHCGSI
jgi:hypothetical protein